MKQRSSFQPTASAGALSRKTSRRFFFSASGKAVAGVALAGVAIPRVHAAEDNTIRLALIGCGGRGTGAVANAVEAGAGPVKLVAMADLFAAKLSKSYESLSEKYASSLDVPPDRRFLGFDAYRKAIDCLRPGDVALLTTHAAFRPLQMEYAVERGVHVFMEKSFAPDPGGLRRILRVGEAADKKGIKIAVGLMCRHSSARQALIERIRDGALGNVQLVRAYRLDSSYALGLRPPAENEVLWQIQHPYNFFWTSSGLLIEMMIHQVDECCWIKDAWPVSAHGLGGRSPSSQDRGQNFEAYSVEYTFPDGAKALVASRYWPGCHNEFATFAHGAKCAAQFSGNIHAPTVQIYKDQRTDPNNIAWRPPREQVSPYLAEWKVLLEAIRNNQPHNESRRAVYANLAAVMGRAAVHSGKIITWEEVLASTFEFARDIDHLTQDSPAPVRADAQGQYPVPVPGTWAEV
jgi:predicted dehydrogenase